MSKKLAAEKKGIQTMLKKAKTEASSSSKKSGGAPKKSSQQQSSSSTTTRVPKDVKNVEEIRKKVEAELAEEDQHVPEPPFQYETHVKRQLLYVRVQLHKIPHKFIDLEGTNDHQLVVDTTKFTRKMKLVFEFPDNMTVDSSKAEYEFESGQLRCTFPIRQLPSSETSRIKDIIQQQKNARKLRFEHQLDQNTGMEQRVRTRTLDLSMTDNPNQKRKLKKQHQQLLEKDAALNGRSSAHADNDDGEDVPPPTMMSAREEREMLLKINKNSGSKGNKSSAAAASGSNKTSSTASSNNKYVSDSEGAKQIASQVSREASKNIKENISKIKKLQAEQSQKKQKSLSSSQHKKEVLNRSFMDVLKQKQQSVREQIEASKPVPKKEKTGPTKSVSFS